MHPHPTTIDELCARMEDWASTYYRREGTPTGTAYNIVKALKPLRELAGYEPPGAITAELLYDARQLMLDQGLSRGTINDRLRWIKLMLRWAARPPRRWIEPQVVADAALTESLKKWRTEAPEGPGVHPVPWELVSATIDVAEVWLSVLIRCHWYTGMRPAEAALMKRSEISERDGFLVYRPRLHKMAYMDRPRQIVFGPQGQAALRPWLAVLPSVHDRLFPIKTSDSYRKAVTSTNKRHKLLNWNPNQIRHSFCQRVGLIDLDGARAAAGHAKMDMTIHYAEHDLQKAMEIQAVHG